MPHVERVPLPTAPPELLARGMDVLVGSDSLLTGDGDLLDELRAARALSLLCDERLLDAVGATAARRLGLPAPSLDPGTPADLAVFRRPVLSATLTDVVLVMVDGVVRVLDPMLSPARPLGAGGRAMEVAGVTRWICDHPAS